MVNCVPMREGSQNLPTHRVLQFEIDAPFFTVSSQKVAFKCCKCIKTHTLLLLNPKFQAFYSSSVAVQLGLCPTWSDTPKTGFLRMMLISSHRLYKNGHTKTFG